MLERCVENVLEPHLVRFAMLEPDRRQLVRHWSVPQLLPLPSVYPVQLPTQERFIDLDRISVIEDGVVYRCRYGVESLLLGGLYQVGQSPWRPLGLVSLLPGGDGPTNRDTAIGLIAYA